ncbi:hypothetical protein [Cryobacterium soli]|jgi:hypothetical protein|uniref:hypothetical protein n=1 Tax=Cryobacterium soli TaxID=2220095 RepID=UPI0013C3FA10|nr:hypothetical protein [Cryobacterium soli]
MTANQFLRIAIRRWYIVLLCAVLTVIGMLIASRPNPVFWTRVNVVFLAPTSLDNPNALRDTTENLVSFAALVDRQYNGNAAVPRFSSQEARLYGAGERAGSAVSLLNSGGQWNDSFIRPELTVEVVGDNEADVLTTLGQITERIDRIVDEQQDVVGVSGADRITTLMSPQTAVVSSAQGNRLRALGAILLLGAGACVVATGFVDRLLLRRAGSRLSAETARVEVD